MSNHVVFQAFEAAMRDAGPALAREQQEWMFDRGEWFELAARHTPNGDPLVIKGEAADSRCWLFCGRDGVSALALSNWYSLRYGVVTEGPTPPYDQLVTGLRKAGIARIQLEPTGPEEEFVAALRKRAWLVRREQINVSWRIDVAGQSFEEYWQARPSRLRNTYKRKVKKAGLDCRIHSHFDHEMWSQVCEVFDNSWKEPDGTPELTYEFFRQEAEAGTLRLGLAYREGRPVAAQLWTIEGRTAIIHLLAYREDEKNLSAGTILSHELFRHAIDEERVDLIDFGIGDHTYKREWMDFSVPLYSLTAYHTLSLSGLAQIACMIGRKVRTALPFRRGKDGEPASA